MTESVTFQAILEQGRREQGLERGLEQGLERGKLQEAIKLLMKLGRQAIRSDLNRTWQSSIDQITDLSRIEHFIDRLLEVNSWNELLALPEEGNGQD